MFDTEESDLLLAEDEPQEKDFSNTVVPISIKFIRPKPTADILDEDKTDEFHFNYRNVLPFTSTATVFSPNIRYHSIKDELIESLKLKIILKLQEVNIQDDKITQTVLQILHGIEYSLLNEIIISKTADFELLVYRKTHKGLYNLIIDEDGDVAFSFLGKKSGNWKTGFFESPTSIDIPKMAALIQGQFP